MIHDADPDISGATSTFKDIDARFRFYVERENGTDEVTVRTYLDHMMVPRSPISVHALALLMVGVTGHGPEVALLHRVRGSRAKVKGESRLPGSRFRRDHIMRMAVLLNVSCGCVKWGAEVVADRLSSLDMSLLEKPTTIKAFCGGRSVPVVGPEDSSLQQFIEDALAGWDVRGKVARLTFPAWLLESFAALYEEWARINESNQDEEDDLASRPICATTDALVIA